MKLGEKQTRDLRPDAQAFDEVRITTVPRYKTSGLSGDEWRISAKVELMRKGRVIVTEGCRDVETACKLLAWYHAKACGAGKGWFAGVDDQCDQEGCAEPATVTLRKKQDYCRDGHPHEIKYGEKVRRFCARHSTRGDCGLDDADANYEIIEGAVSEPTGSDERPSVFGGTIFVGGIDASAGSNIPPSTSDSSATEASSKDAEG